MPSGATRLPMSLPRPAIPCSLVLATALAAQSAAILHVPGGDGPARGAKVVLIAGDEEYRSEEALPMLARILAVHHGFDCHVLFHQDPASGVIDPGQATHVPGLELLEGAELVVIALRFRRWQDSDMARFAAHVDAGRPIVALRTSTHAFAYPRNDSSPFAGWSFDRAGGFGKRVLGETWVAHHGEHGSQGTRGVLAKGHEQHPILRGVRDVFGPTDVYAIGPLPEDADVLMHGAVVDGLGPDAKPVAGVRNEPMMPLIWTRERRLAEDRVQRIVCSTIGAASDFASEDLRRAFVNACYWATGREEALPERARADPVGVYAPSPFGFGRHRHGITPAMLAIPAIPPVSPTTGNR